MLLSQLGFVLQKIVQANRSAHISICFQTAWHHSLTNSSVYIPVPVRSFLAEYLSSLFHFPKTPVALVLCRPVN